MTKRLVLAAVLALAAVAVCVWNPDAQPDFVHDDALDVVYGDVPNVTKQVRAVNRGLESLDSSLRADRRPQSRYILARMGYR